MRNRIYQVISMVFLVYALPSMAARALENLDRGVVAVHTGGSNVFVSWRLLGTEPRDLGFNLYRNGIKLNSAPITGATNYQDNAGSATASYVVKTVVNGVEVASSSAVQPFSTGLTKRIPLSRPAGGTTPSGEAYTYSPNDGSAGDLDGDGRWDLVFKWEPSNAKDNSQSGYTGNVYLEGITLDGKRLFRIDLGRNIRAGAHYTQFVVADFDLDGKAEIICKTAPGTRDGLGNYLSTGPAANDNDAADYRNSSGYVLDGPEYLTVFRGTDGKELATVNYNPPRGTVSSWGDSYGNRVDRFLATAAWLDGVKPSAVMQRGYYTRMAITAYDWDGKTLSQRWYYNAATPGQQCYGQGNHNLSVGDVDGDGKDEIIQGACAIDDNGTFMYRTGLGHGDAMHLGDLDPNRPGLEVWEVHEDANAAYGYEMHDARTGQIIWGVKTSSDNGRGLAADIDPASPGYEMWSAAGAGIYSPSGTQVSTSKPSINFRIYWDGDLQDELLDAIGSTPSPMKIDSWKNGRLVSTDNRWGNYTGITINGTKANPVLVADLLGDWREEMILRENTDEALILYTTTIPTTHRLYTLMHDPMYRAAISWQNTAYNQPPHLSFFLGNGTDKAPTPNITLIGSLPAPSSSAPSSSAPSSSSRVSSSSAVPSSSSAAPSSSSALPADCAGVPGGVAKLDLCGRCVGGNTGLTACGSVRQAEVFCQGDGVAESRNAGFLGSGYFNFNNAVGAAVKYALRVPAAINTSLYVRVANGGIDPRTLSVTVNGTPLRDTITAPVGEWTEWTVLTVPISLRSGVNELILTSLMADGGPNLDLLGFAASGIDSASCSETPVAIRAGTDISVVQARVQVQGRQLRFMGDWGKSLRTVRLIRPTGQMGLTLRSEQGFSSMEIPESGLWIVEVRGTSGFWRGVVVAH